MFNKHVYCLERLSFTLIREVPRNLKVCISKFKTHFLVTFCWVFWEHAECSGSFNQNEGSGIYETNRDLFSEGWGLSPWLVTGMWNAITWVLHYFFPSFLKTGYKGSFKYEKDGGRTEMEEEMERVGEGKEPKNTWNTEMSTMSRRLNFEMWRVQTMMEAGVHAYSVIPCHISNCVRVIMLIRGVLHVYGFVTEQCTLQQFLV